MQSRIMYMETKLDGLRGEGHIGRVTFSKTGKTLYYNELTFTKTAAVPLKANYYEKQSFQDYWISGPKKNGEDSLFPSVIQIDDDVREEYWTVIRRQPERVQDKTYRSPGKTKAEREALEKGLRRRQMDNGWGPT